MYADHERKACMGRDPCPVFLKGKGLSVYIDVCCVSLFAAFFQFGAFFLSDASSALPKHRPKPMPMQSPVEVL